MDPDPFGSGFFIAVLSINHESGRRSIRSCCCDHFSFVVKEECFTLENSNPGLTGPGFEDRGGRLSRR